MKRHCTAVVIAAYSLLAAVMTYPQVLRLSDGVRDGGDPLLNTWIMWWEVDSILRGDFAGFFDANIFFPHYRTLAYSEFLLPQTLAATPLMLLFDNPLIAYNAVLLGSFVVTALAMYVLGKYLTGSSLAGFVSGLAMAFAPFMFEHLSHLQVITAGGIPLAFYFLHRYFNEGSLRLLLGFSAAYTAQCLANAYYALYLTYAAGAYIVYRAVRDRRLASLTLYRHLGIHTALAMAALGPFFGQYLLLRRDLGFFRRMVFEGGWYSFFAAPSINRLYGDLTEPLHTTEAALFPGLCIAALAVVGVMASGNGRSTSSGSSSSGVATPSAHHPPPASQGLRFVPPASSPAGAVWAYRTLGAFMVLAWLAILAISLTGGIDTSVAGIPLRARGFRNPLIGLALGIGARALLRRTFPGLGRRRRWLREPRGFYAGMMFVVFLLTLGPAGPYRLLYAYAPGFDGIRAVPRIHILTVFCLAVFVAYGFQAARQRLQRRNIAWVAAALPVLIVAESFSVPVPMFEVRWGEGIPGVYRWLADQDGDFAVVEYPIDPDLEFERMFYSILHGKKIVNGMSGYQSPVYREMRRRMWAFPSAVGVRDLRALGIRWVIVHPDQYLEYWPEFEPRFADYRDDLVRIAEIDGALVFEVRGGDWLSRDELAARRRGLGSVLISPDGWTVTASSNDLQARLALDGDASTRWATEAQEPGSFFEADFGRQMDFDRLVLRFEGPREYPRGYRVEVSNGAADWRTVAEDVDVSLTIIERLDLRLAINLPATRARRLRIVQTGLDRAARWAINEIEVRRRADGGG